MRHILIPLFALACISEAQVVVVGKCPNVTVQHDFDPTRYFGQWYEITKFYASFENGQKCDAALYTPKPDGHFIVFNSGLDSQDHKVNATGDGYIPDANEKAKIKVRFDTRAPYADYWVLDTDYTGHTLIFSCINILDVSHLEFSWILSRQTTLDPVIRARLYQKMQSFGINTKNYVDNDQTHCNRKI